ncbi:hypothetical protein [Streptacidiphilus fuscans]|uniref:Uncharacterized protein n=1 Tax=Streptacidiphilus fuscans TaxID=2789292 RepID=A0A931B884_9ACTN|nr:hypothetical protein [Streptacidiphilus fuscans]MBF9072013.1 hypothetical protein [Streptacidiphilus fuscans]
MDAHADPTSSTEPEPMRAAEAVDENVYDSVHRLRADAWASLEEAARRLATLPRTSDARPDLDARVEELLDLLGPIESCWSAPGTAAVRELRALHRAGDARKLTDRLTEVRQPFSG